VSTRLRWVIAAGVLLLFLVFTGLGSEILHSMGDTSVPITYINETDQRVIVSPYGRSYPAAERTLDPGASAEDDLLVSNPKPNTFVTRLEAFDASGQLLYCHKFTVGDLQSLNGQVRIRLGEKSC
jgi:hypothetical protein